MKLIFAIFAPILIVLLTSFAQAQSNQTNLSNQLASIMKDKVGLGFKVIATHILKEKRINADGTTLSAAKLTLEGLTAAQGIVPKSIEGTPDKVERLKNYDQFLVEIIEANNQLIKAIEANDFAAAQKTVMIMMGIQKKAHADFKE